MLFKDSFIAVFMLHDSFISVNVFFIGKWIVWDNTTFQTNCSIDNVICMCMA